ncbi:MAG: epsH 1 [Gemmatimonadetes bacterium]|nr:epsH 1 [Gemmatimonadota bacterium]
MSSVSIVIPFHSNINYLFSCLASLEPGLSDDDEIIVVVNDDLLDESLGFEAYPRVKPIYFTEVLGYSKACNIGARSARGDFLFFCDTDTLTVTPHALNAHRAEFHTARDVGATSSLLLSPATAHVHDFGLGWSGHNIIHPFRFAHPSDPRVRTSRYVQMACSAHMMTPRSVFLQLGGFDEGLRHYYQDTDYCVRLKDLSLGVRVVPAARAFHRGSSASINRAAFRADDRAVFTAKNLKRLRRDYEDYLEESLGAWSPDAARRAFYNVAILSTIYDPQQILEPISRRVDLRPYCSRRMPERDLPRVDLFDELGRSAALLPDPFLFVVDRVSALPFNAIWHHLRGERGDVAVDRNGEFRPTRELFL